MNKRTCIFAFSGLAAMIAAAAWPVLRNGHPSVVEAGPPESEPEANYRDRDPSSDALPPATRQGVGRVHVQSKHAEATGAAATLRIVVPPMSPWETPGPGDEVESNDDVSDDEGASRYDNSPEQRKWRATFANEVQDDAWTDRMRKELDRQAAGMRDGLEVSPVSCRETLCRVVLRFDSHVDAEAFQKAEHSPALQYEFQSLSPTLPNGGSEEWGYSYELMVKRERPAGAPQAGASRHTSSTAAVAPIPPGGQG